MIEDVLLALGLLALVFVPALCFIALFRLIDYVADDELIARVQNGEINTRGPTGQQSPNSTKSSQSSPPEAPDLRSPDGTESTAADRSDPGDGAERTGIRCRTCGTSNWEGATFCQNCLRRVS